MLTTSGIPQGTFNFFTDSEAKVKLNRNGRLNFLLHLNLNLKLLLCSTCFSVST